MAVAVSAGMPTSQGSQYLECRPPIAMSHGWTNSEAPRSSHVCTQQILLHDVV